MKCVFVSTVSRVSLFTWFFELLLTLVLGMLWSQGKCKGCINILSHCIVSHLQNPVQLRRAVDQSSQVHADQPEVVLVLDPGPGCQGSHRQLILYAASLSLSDHPGPFSNTVLWLKHTWQVAMGTDRSWRHRQLIVHASPLLCPAALVHFPARS